MLKQFDEIISAVKALKKTVKAALKAAKTPVAKVAKAKPKAKVAKAKAKVAKTKAKQGAPAKGSPEWKAREAARVKAWRERKKAEAAGKAKPTKAKVAKPAKVAKVKPAKTVEAVPVAIVVPAPPAPTTPDSPLAYVSTKANPDVVTYRPDTTAQVRLEVSGVEYELDDDIDRETLPQSLIVTVDKQTAQEALEDDLHDNLLRYVETALSDAGHDTFKVRPIGVAGVAVSE